MNIVAGQKISTYDDLFGKNLGNRILVVQLLRRNYKKETNSSIKIEKTENREK